MHFPSFFFLFFTTEASNNYIPPTMSPPVARIGGILSYFPSLDVLFTFGGYEGTTFYSDSWYFYLKNEYWEEIVPHSETSPSSRSYFGGFYSLLTNKYYIFGGRALMGLQNDFWEFDPKYSSWTKIVTKNPPISRCCFAYTNFVNNNKEYFAIFGGISENYIESDLFILDMESLEWTQMENYGDEIDAFAFNVMVYYDGCLYLTNGSGEFLNDFFELYQYVLDDEMWVIIDGIEDVQSRGYNSGFVYDGSFYIFFGYLTDFVDTVIKIDLDSNDYCISEVDVGDGLLIDSFGLANKMNTAYIFSGYDYSYDDFTNTLMMIDLDGGPIQVVSENLIHPEKKLHSSIVAINGELYLFGGISNNILYNNLWLFNIENEKWTQKHTSGELPTPRYGHAADSDGDAMIVWGGEDFTGLKDDIYIFNALNYNWKKMISKSDVVPKPTTGSCIVLKFPLVYIYGGITQSGTSGEFWQFDIISLEYKKISDFNPKAYPKCYLQNNLFYIIGGSLKEYDINFSYFIYNFTSNLWTNNIFEELNFKNGIYEMMDTRFIVIGGQEWFINLSNDAYVISNYSIYSPLDLYDFVYFSSYIYYKDRIYSYGGGDYHGDVPVFILGTYSFYYIEIEDFCLDDYCKSLCSKGTYMTKNGCLECKPGYYSEVVGNDGCVPCPSGTYNFNKGASSYRQCYPCFEGTFAENPGSTSCLQCPSDSFCPSGGRKPYKSIVQKGYQAIQPKIYSQKYNNAENVYSISVLCFFTLLLTTFLFVSGLKKYFKVIDLYSKEHNYELNIPMIMQKTTTGGFFSLIFIAIAIVLVGVSIINYYVDNIHENKSLVPLLIIEENVKAIIADKINIECTIVGYGGTCGNNEKCNSQIIITVNNLLGSSFDYNCTLSEYESCIVTVTCYDCQVRDGAKVSVMFKEKLSYSSAILVNVTSDSSIPNEVSSVRDVVYASEKHMFIGSEASEFYFLMTPSLFASETSNWPRELTGYHVLSEKIPLEGSQALNIDLPITGEIKVIIYLNKSTTGLYTIRLLKQGLILLISSILGSVTGAMGILAFLMSSAENVIMKIMKRHMKIGVNDVFRGRRNIDLMYFGRVYRKNVQFGNKVYPVYETENDKLKEQSLEI